MPETTAIVRQWTLMRALTTRHYGMTVRAMAEEAGVSLKTIRRDLESLLALGFALEDTIGECGRKTWKIKDLASLPPLNLNVDEAIALYLGRRQLDVLAGTPFHDAAWDAYRKLRVMFPQTAIDYLEQIAGMYHPASVAPCNYQGKSDLIDDLRTAIEERRAIHILYQSDHATEPAFRDVYPYAFADKWGVLYLIAHDPREDKIKHYKVVRIEDVDLTEIRFQRPKDFDLMAYLAKSFGIYHGDGDFTVRVHFAASVARYVLETHKHPSEQHTKQRDGSLIAEYRLSCTEEIRSWILSFGRKAVVLEPESLRDEIAEELQSMLGAYRRSDHEAQDGSDGRSNSRAVTTRPSKPSRSGR